MKTFFVLLALAIAACIQSCGLVSLTTIDGNRSFVLGEGVHGSYSAQVRNESAVDVEVLTRTDGGTEISTGILKAGQQQTYNVGPTTSVRFKNLSALPAAIKINLIGDENLSMGYRDNK